MVFATAFFRPLPIPKHIKPAIGGLLVGAIGYFLPQVLGMGYGWAQLAIDGQLPLRLAIAHCHSENRCHRPYDWVGRQRRCVRAVDGDWSVSWRNNRHSAACVDARRGLQPAAYVLVGMAGFFAGVSKAPIATLI